MKFVNVNSFKAEIRNIAKEKGIPAQQVQQNYLIEQVLRWNQRESKIERIMMNCKIKLR